MSGAIILHQISFFFQQTESFMEETRLNLKRTDCGGVRHHNKSTPKRGQKYYYSQKVKELLRYCVKKT